MDIRDIAFAVGMFFIVNLSMFFFYPLFGSIVGNFGVEGSGSFGLTDNAIAIGWGAYFLIWAFGGWIAPIYFFLKGTNSN